MLNDKAMLANWISLLPTYSNCYITQLVQNFLYNQVLVH